MGEIVYMLCALTSTLCAWLLFRAYLRNPTRLIFWSMLCFAGLAINNIFLYVHVNFFIGSDLKILRTVPAFLGLFILVYGLVQDTTE